MMVYPRLYPINRASDLAQTRPSHIHTERLLHCRMQQMHRTGNCIEGLRVQYCNLLKSVCGVRGCVTRLHHWLATRGHYATIRDGRFMTHTRWTGVENLFCEFSGIFGVRSLSLYRDQAQKWVIVITWLRDDVRMQWSDDRVNISVIARIWIGKLVLWIFGDFSCR